MIKRAIAKRIALISLPAALFLAFLCLVYIHLLMGTRRLVHDTYICVHPSLAYLSDSLKHGVFPFWDPFSSPGSSTAVLGFYSPLHVVLALLFPYSADVVVLEFVLLGAIGLIGTYLWLKCQPLPKPLALAGAIAYVGSGPYLSLNTEVLVLFTASFIPWLLLSVDLLTAGTGRRDALRGAFILITSVWMIMTGGYPGLNYMALLFVGIYGLARVFLNRETGVQAFQFGIVSILITLALLFLPLSEMFESFVPQMLSARKMWGVYNPFLGSIAIAGPLNLFFPNGICIPEMSFIGRLMYMSVLLVATIPAGLATVRLSKKNALLLGLSILIILSSMDSFSPVAVFFVKYVPGFSQFRYHAYNSNLVVLLLIALSLRLINQYQALVLKQPHLRFRYVWTTLATFILAVLAASLAMFCSRSPAPLSITWYDLACVVAVFLLSGVILFWWFMCESHSSAKRNNRMRIMGMSTLLLFITFVIILFVRFFPSDWAAQLVRVFHGGQQTLEHVARYGLPALADGLDRKFISVPLWRMFAIDALQLSLILGIFLFCAYRCWRYPRQLSWTLLLLIFVDISVAVPKYELGNTYCIVGQMGRTEIHFQRPETIAYTSGNERDPILSYVSLIDWHPIRSYVNMAQQLRSPTFYSCGPYANQQITGLMRQPGGVEVFSKLLWLLPQNNEISLDKWGTLAKVPDIQSLSLQPNRFDIVVNSSGPAVLVWTDAWAAGWRVSVNGSPAVLCRVLAVLKGVDIPSGRSEVVFTYQPTYYMLGMILMFVGLLGFGVLTVFVSLHRK